LISVVIPTNRVTDSLVTAIKSTCVAAQNLTVEILVVVNNTNQDVEKITLLQLSNEERLICTFLHSGNGTLSDALNFGVNVSKYELIARMDHDDEMFPERLSAQYREFSARPKLVLLGGNALMVDPTGKELGKVVFPQSDDQLKFLLNFGNCFAHPTVMFRKSAYLSVGGYGNNFPYAEDYDFFVRLSSVGEVANMHNLFVKYQIDSSQTSSIHYKQQLSSANAIVTLLGIQDFELRDINYQDHGILDTDLLVRSNLFRLFPVSEMSGRVKILGRLLFSIARRNHRNRFWNSALCLTLAYILNFRESIKASKMLTSKMISS
jgi:glycosyltransferase involved in cell wall biosynthesis